VPSADSPRPSALELFLEQTKGFRLAPALYNDLLERDATIRELTAQMAASGLRVLTLDLRAQTGGRNLVDRVRSLVESAPGERVAVMVVDLETRVDYTPELSKDGGAGLHFIHTANFHRELFPAACPGPLVIWMTELLERAFVRSAPDLWHWRSHVFDLRTRRTDRAVREKRLAVALGSDDFRRHPADRLRRLEEELAAYRQAGSRWEEMRVLNAMGAAHLDAANARAALKDFTEALAIARELRDRFWEGAGLGNLGLACASLGDLHKAIEFYEQARIVSREIGDRRGEAVALINIGTAYKNLGDPRKAISFHGQGLIVLREIGDRRGEGTVLGNLGVAHAVLGDPRKAIEFYEQHLVIAREVGDRRGEGSALGNLGLAYADLGDARKAIEFYEQQLVIVREIGDRRGEGNASFNLALELWPAGERDRAREIMEHAWKIYTEIEDASAERASAILQEWREEMASGRGA
jgi:tetratricopeptide (TPR) repeat protein